MAGTLEHSPCEPIAEQVGTPPDEDLFGNFREEFEGIANNLIAGNVRGGQELSNGVAAERALSWLGCDACELSQVCTTKKALEESVRVGKENTALEEKISMLGSGPRWLSAARLHRAGTDPETVRQNIADIETTKAAMATGELDIDNLLAGVENWPDKTYSKSELPELQGIKKLPDDVELDGHKIAVNEHVFTVVDASDALGLGGNIRREGYSILCDKLIQRMGEKDASGNPQILKSDEIMQKALRQLKGGRLDEMRMGGKNRMYFTVTSEGLDEGTAARIVILGTHGGDASNQEKFLGTLLG